jgi:hypothetical protein
MMLRRGTDGDRRSSARAARQPERGRAQDFLLDG